MPIEVFASCVGDLATLGGSVGRDIGMKSFTLAVPLCCDRVEFLRRGDGSMAHEGSGRCLDKYSVGA